MTDLEGLLPTFAGSATRHGTISGWTLHKKRGQEPCPPCNAAKSEYDGRRRDAPEAVRRNRLHAAAQQAARGELAQKYYEEYRDLYEKHKIRLMRERGL